MCHDSNSQAHNQVIISPITHIHSSTSSASLERFLMAPNPRVLLVARSQYCLQFLTVLFNIPLYISMPVLNLRPPRKEILKCRSFCWRQHFRVDSRTTCYLDRKLIAPRTERPRRHFPWLIGWSISQPMTRNPLRDASWWLFFLSRNMQITRTLLAFDLKMGKYGYKEKQACWLTVKHIQRNAPVRRSRENKNLKNE